MKDFVFVYDNHNSPNVFIKNVVGEKKFAEIILRRQSVRQKFIDSVKDLPCINQILPFDNIWELDNLLATVRLKSNIPIFHFFSHQIIADREQAVIIFKKACYVKIPLVVIQEGIPVGFVFPEPEQYADFLLKQVSHLLENDTYKIPYAFDVLPTQAFFNISVFTNFTRFISGGFDARFFNTLSSDEYTVTKTSENKKKIKSEYTFYHLLPDNMKPWFVIPYDYAETKTTACYSMERYNFTDLAIRWVHGAVDEDEFRQLMNRTMHFISIRHTKEIPQIEYIDIVTALYIEKPKERIETLKQSSIFPTLESFILHGTAFSSVEEILELYLSLIQKFDPMHHLPAKKAIGHGDLCFSNMLYNKEASLLKLIDPKGALTDEELWTDPYYDIAKLSHSICGKYDFFNNMLHRIALGDSLKFQLLIDFDNDTHIKMFRQACEDNGYDFQIVRLYEASLFLSMLPLHIDNPQKVFAFILNAIEILTMLGK